MFHDEKDIPRRTFLRGVGATSRCRCSSRWCPARRSLAQTAAQLRRRASRASSFRTARRRATGCRATEGATSSCPFIYKPLERFGTSW